MAPFEPVRDRETIRSEADRREERRDDPAPNRSDATSRDPSDDPGDGSAPVLPDWSSTAREVLQGLAEERPECANESSQNADASAPVSGPATPDTLPLTAERKKPPQQRRSARERPSRPAFTVEQRVLILDAWSSSKLTGTEFAPLVGVAPHTLYCWRRAFAAMSRSNIAETDRRDWYLYVDEFQNFATESFATILSEARKYRLDLTIANQYLAQMDEQTAAAVFGNVGTLLCFQVGANDAEVLAQQLGGDLTPQDLMRLPRYATYARLLINGMPSRPFSMHTIPPKTKMRDADRSDVVRRYSRQRYTRPRSLVESEITNAFAHA